MRKELVSVIFLLGACGGQNSGSSYHERTTNIPYQGDNQEESGREQNEDANKPLIGECEDRLNRIKVRDKCYARCDKAYQYCLRHDEMGSQLDPNKKVPMCHFEDGNILVDDKCGRGVLTIDSEKMLFKVGNDKTNQAFYEYLDGSEYADKYSENIYGDLNLHVTTAYNYPSSYPMIPDTGTMLISTRKIRAGRINPGVKENAKLNWILNINGLILDTKGINTKTAMEYCENVLGPLAEGDRNSKIEFSITNPQDDTNHIYCSTTLISKGHLSMAFYCHMNTDRCFIEAIDLWNV